MFSSYKILDQISNIVIFMVGSQWLCRQNETQRQPLNDSILMNWFQYGFDNFWWCVSFYFVIENVEIEKYVFVDKN